jgi:hypothetical protein
MTAAAHGAYPCRAAFAFFEESRLRRTVFHHGSLLARGARGLWRTVVGETVRDLEEFATGRRDRTAPEVAP